MADLHGVSKEQKHYLQHEKRNQYLVQFLRVLLLLFLLSLISMGNHSQARYH